MLLKSAYSVSQEKLGNEGYVTERGGVKKGANMTDMGRREETRGCHEKTIRSSI